MRHLLQVVLLEVARPTPASLALVPTLRPQNRLPLSRSFSEIASTSIRICFIRVPTMSAHFVSGAAANAASLHPDEAIRIEQRRPSDSAHRLARYRRHRRCRRRHGRALAPPAGPAATPALRLDDKAVRGPSIGAR